MAEQCEQLMAHLDDAIDVTLLSAPVRLGKRYLPLSRTKVTLSPAHPEAQLERSMHRQWSQPGCAAEGCWERIVAFQVNLPNKRAAEGWGEIDLLGIAPDGLPVVIELKQADSNETPAAILVQAAADGVALQKGWWKLRSEWRERAGVRRPLPAALRPCQLVGAAPEEYWGRWTLAAKEASALATLRAAFTERGLPSTLAALSRDDAGSHVARVV